jgi:hypothetical protein
MKTIRNNSDFLRILATSKDKQKKALLKTCSDNNIKAISEIALNTLSGNIKLTKTKKDRLRRFKSALRTLAKKTVPLKKKRQIINQKGGALFPLLIPPVLSLLSSYAARALSS